ncbi:MAG: hypothetical protein NTY56_00400 [Patescibacteria group bacterium]|nr:hypothetical protein [Patescibacteria group bacterium]
MSIIPKTKPISSKLLDRIKRDAKSAKFNPSNSYTDSWLDGAEWGDGSH